jgi:hypothetical protein
MDTMQIQFRTATPNYLIVDAPGHGAFRKNMATGAASADAAFLNAVDDSGQEQSGVRTLAQLARDRQGRQSKSDCRLSVPEPVDPPSIFEIANFK